jgi:hypothetical protein
MESVGQPIMVLLTTYGMSVLGAIVILILGWTAARIGRRITENLFRKSSQRPCLVALAGVIYWASFQRTWAENGGLVALLRRCQIGHYKENSRGYKHSRSHFPPDCVVQQLKASFCSI